MERNEIYGNQPDQKTVINFTRFLGTWVNFYDQTTRLKKFILSEREQRFFIHVYGAENPEDWGEVEIAPFIDNLGELAFSAFYESESSQSLLAANHAKGLWAIVEFHQLKNSDESRHFYREFYYKLV
ncbi:hypothetical protein [Gloeothece verrucosa]|uniref:Uncharacterized protein n=1 Tax=Gloeothece verrucosa (strain PCC 7822) TaxID=497965 RepID=E0UKY5_GLOV7|nr:hypothetical protein [Gloeothece verrucosa]ADN17615.1 hypothetical protein Cyan7822_5754 [Gloeothece verrucosa PCC 7822]